MKEPGPSEKNISLAILPFRFHHNGEAMDDLLGFGLADTLTVEFHKIENLNVRPVSQIKSALAKAADSIAAARLLEVDYLLEGQIFPARAKIRFTVQLLRVKDGSVVWAGEFDEAEDDDVLMLEDLISKRISEAVGPHLKSSVSDFVRRDLPPITGSSYKSGDTNEITGALEDIVVKKNEAPEAEISETFEPIREKFRYDLVFAALLILIVIAGGLFAWNRGLLSAGSTSTNKKTPSIIVLPFHNLEAKSFDSSLGTGLAESISDSLGNVQNVFVLSATAGRRISEPDVLPAQIGRDFGVDYLMRGKIVSDSAGSVQVIPELVSTGDGKIVWTETFSAPGNDMRQLQSQIIEKALKALDVEITDAEKRKISQRQPNNGLAYELYLAGRYQMATRSENGLKRAIELFSQSISKDSNFALAYVGIADAYSLQYLYQIPPPPDAYDKAKNSVLQALKINEDLTEAHASLAYILFNGERNRGEAEKQYRRAIELNPSYATAHHWFSLMLSAMGRHDEAIAEIEMARRLNPRSAVIVSAKSMIYYHARQYEEAIKQSQLALELDNGYIPALKGLRWIYTSENNYALARETFLKEKTFAGAAEDQKGWMILEAQVEAIGSSPENARSLLEKALSDEFVRNNPAAYAWEIALAYSELDDKDKTIEWLEKAEAARDHGIIFIEIEPRLQKYLTDPRFIRLVNKVRMPLQ